MNLSLQVVYKTIPKILDRPNTYTYNPFACPKGRYYIENYFGLSNKLIHFIQKQE